MKTFNFALKKRLSYADLKLGFCFIVGGNFRVAGAALQTIALAGDALKDAARRRAFQGCFLLLALFIFSAPAFAADSANVISLSGKWRFCLGGPEPAKTQAALPALTFSDTIELPGTTDTRQKGPENQERWKDGLTRVHKWNGSAWYEREVVIPEYLRGKRITLFLERTKYTQIWLDGKPRGESPIVCTPQEYALGQIEPGTHKLTIVIDNSRRPLNVEAHQFSDNTQGNWNGIIGRMELIANDPVKIDDAQVYPDVAQRRIKVRVAVKNDSGSLGQGVLDFVLRGSGYAQNRSNVPINWDSKNGSVEVEIPLGADAKVWDEFHPELNKLTITLRSPNGADERSITFGLREFKTRDGQFSINGRTAFLRGKHDGCVFPMTGHPPMDVDGWLDYFKKCKEYGINHIRCHTWVPPEAAFAAADILGIYLQPELPFWGAYSEETRRALLPEALRILKIYGNHPSFVMMTLGNEIGGNREIMAQVVSELRNNDPRHLYAQGSNNYYWDPALPPGDDFWTTVRTRLGGQMRNVRGSFATADGGNGHIQIGPPCTTNTYSAAIAGVTAPVVGHEIAQYTVYPDFKEIPKYTGVFRARNFELFRGKLPKAGMLEQADDFVHSSGALAALCYREEIEAALRTPGFGGFQLLDLQDFPGQGTALVGLLNAFMESKGLIKPAKWRQFCSPIVPLACFDRYTWTTRDSFNASIKIAHYGENDLQSTVEWTLSDAKGHRVASGKFAPAQYKQGGLREVGNLTIPLSNVAAPAPLTLNLRANRSIQNSYTIWVYPEQVETAPLNGVVLARSFDSETSKALADGKRVVLIPRDGSVSRSVGGGFATDFWCWPMFHNRPGTMGILCDPKHPALARFPTENHSDWQWFHIATNSQPVIMDDLPGNAQPIIQVIDNLDRSYKLGLVFEGCVGTGRLLVCAVDLLNMPNRPEARQLLRSLLDYAASDKFQPRCDLPSDKVRKIFAPTVPVRSATASSAQDTHTAFCAVDKNPSTRWCASDSSPKQWLRLDLGDVCAINGCRIAWESTKPGYSYVLEGSTDGTTWKVLSDQRKNDFKAAHELEFPAVQVRFVRLVISALPPGQWASISELTLLQADL